MSHSDLLEQMIIIMYSTTILNFAVVQEFIPQNVFKDLFRIF